VYKRQLLHLPYYFRQTIANDTIHTFSIAITTKGNYDVCILGV
jgi:hypothetical protein